MSAGALVALRDRRQAVVQCLSDAYAEDLLDLAAFEERLARAHGATDLATLDALVVDLQPTAHATLAPLVSNVPAPPRRKLRAIFSSIERSGAWSVPTTLEVSAVFGSTELDFRQAVFQPGVTEISVRAVFGSVEIIVPPHLPVECDGSAIFASFEHRHSGAVDDDPMQPRLRVVGSAVFGSVEIKLRLPLLDQLKQLIGIKPKALPPKRADS